MLTQLGKFLLHFLRISFYVCMKIYINVQLLFDQGNYHSYDLLLLTFRFINGWSDVPSIELIIKFFVVKYIIWEYFKVCNFRVQLYHIWLLIFLYLNSEVKPNNALNLTLFKKIKDNSLYKTIILPRVHINKQTKNLLLHNNIKNTKFLTWKTLFKVRE